MTTWLAHSFTHRKPDVGNDSGPPPTVSHHLEYCDKDELDRMLSHSQRDYHVSFAYCIGLHTLLTLRWDSLVPSMITRLILSLKKAAISPDSVWNSTSVGQPGTAIFSPRMVSRTARVRGGNVALSNLSLQGTGGLSRSDDRI